MTYETPADDRHTPPGPLEEAEADLRGIESDVRQMLAKVTGATLG